MSFNYKRTMNRLAKYTQDNSMWENEIETFPSEKSELVKKVFLFVFLLVVAIAFIVGPIIIKKLWI